METCFSYCSPDAGYFSSDEKRWINRIHNLKEQFPDMVTILAEPKDNNGCIYAKMPVKFLRVQGPSAQKELTVEEKEERKTRLKEGLRQKQLREQEKNV